VLAGGVVSEVALSAPQVVQKHPAGANMWGGFWQF
jgi:hypothetical protein